MKNKLNNFLAGTAMLLLIFSILITAFQAAIYGDPNYSFYEKEYEKYNVLEALDMEMSQVMVVTHHMMDYLIGEEGELSIEVKVDGKVQDFFNEQDRLHMKDVADLFIGGLRLRNIALILCLLLLVILAVRRANLFSLLPKAFLVSLIIFAGIVGIIGGLFASDFNKYFTIFHELFFSNDLWVFDYDTDYMIRLLPEGFFFDFVFRIGKFFFGMLGGAAVIAAIIFFLGRYKFTKRGNCDKLLKDKNPNLTEED